MKKAIRRIISTLKNETITKEYEIIKKINNEQDLNQYLKEHLEKLLLHSYQKVPYYRELFDSIELIEKGIVDLSKFSNIPILTKELLNKHRVDLIAEDYEARNYYENSSGGSTGEPTRFLQDESYKKWCAASNQHYYQDILNIQLDDIKKIYLWGSPRDLFVGDIGLRNKINDWLTNTLILNSFKMTTKDMQSHIEKINKYKPELIRGYAGSLYELAKYAEKNNLDIYTPRKLVSSAETLTPQMRKYIEKIFSTKVYDFYGSRETASIAGQCTEGLYHIFSFNNHIEILDRNDRQVKEGEKGRVIVTNLHNYTMPFIRYDVGDLAMLGPKKCSCNQYLPCLKTITGRIEEQFIKKDGSIVIGYFFVHLIGVLVNTGYITKFQVIQEDYEKIRILAVITHRIPKSEKNDIESKIRLQMGSTCEILWDFVPDIPPNKNGKYLYTRSLVTR